MPTAEWLETGILNRRPRRNRKSSAVRALVQENRLHASDLVAPLFITEGENRREPVASMPGVSRLSIDLLVREVAELYTLGIPAINLFAYVPQEKKDALGSEATRPGNLIEQAVRAIKQEVPEICVMVDIALDPYTTAGHDGLIGENGEILNDPTLDVLAKMSIHAAQAGADVVAPSDMMDGRIAYIRESLDQAGFQNVSILSYTAKYDSAFYGPYRNALDSAPRFGDKKSYHLDPANSREAIIEAHLDEAEGADMLLIKPALPYLDIIAKIRDHTALPIGAYHVSGEYAMVMAAAEKGWVDADRVFMESLLGIKRAGADFILTYTARRIAEQL